jgi:CBS domain-containing protein
MLVREVMNKNVMTVKPDLILKKAAEIMSNYHIGSLVVLENNKLTGILTERNVLIAVVDGKDPELTTVEEVMTKKVITIEPDKTIEDAVALMKENNIKKLPVVDNDKLVGIITASDIIVVEPKLIEGIAKLISVNLSGYHGG